ncbi:MAG TPA: hypothetical protein VF331_17275, partial [Polyangiales bacterium]
MRASGPAVRDVRASRTPLGLAQAFCLPRESMLLWLLVAVGAALRVALIIGSPTPYGYVYDFYQDAVAFVYDHHTLPPP